MLAAIIGVPVTAHANVIVPSVAFLLAHGWPPIEFPIGFILALAMAFGIECLVLWRSQPGHSFSKLIQYCFLANLYSTAYGFLLIALMLSPAGVLILAMPAIPAYHAVRCLQHYAQIKGPLVWMFLLSILSYGIFVGSFSISSFRNFYFMGGIHHDISPTFHDLLKLLAFDGISLVMALTLSVALELAVFAKMDKERLLSWRSIALANVLSYVIIGLVMLPIDVKELSDVYVRTSENIANKEVSNQP